MFLFMEFLSSLREFLLDVIDNCKNRIDLANRFYVKESLREKRVVNFFEKHRYLRQQTTRRPIND